MEQEFRPMFGHHFPPHLPLQASPHFLSGLPGPERTLSLDLTVSYEHLVPAMRRKKMP